MAIKKEKKKEIFAALEKAVKGSKSIVFVNFNKLLVKDVSELRRSLKKENVSYMVAKKTIFKKALGGTSVKGNIPEMKGELAVAYLSVEASTKEDGDLLAPARGVYEFQKKLDGKVNIIGGIFDGEYKSKDEMVSIASIPSLQVLRGMFVNIINSPIQRFAIALNQIAEKKN